MASVWYQFKCVNTLRPIKNGRYFADDTFKRIFLNENVIFLSKFHWSLFLRVQLTISIIGSENGDKPLSELMMVKIRTHICVTWPQWVKHALQIAYFRFCFFYLDAVQNIHHAVLLYFVCCLVLCFIYTPCGSQLLCQLTKSVLDMPSCP